MKRSSSVGPIDRTKRVSDEATEPKPVEPEDSELEFEDDYEDDGEGDDDEAETTLTDIWIRACGLHDPTGS